MTRLSIFALCCWVVILAAIVYHREPIIRETMRTVGTGFVVVGYFLIGSAG